MAGVDISDLPIPSAKVDISDLPPPPAPAKTADEEEADNGQKFGGAIKNTAKGFSEMLLHHASGALASLLGTFGAVGSTPVNAVSEALTGKDAIDVPAGMKQVSDALTYQPRSDAGKAFVNTTEAPGKYLQGSTDFVADKLNEVPVAGPALATAAQVVPKIAATVLGSKIPGAAEAEAPVASNLAKPLADSTPLEVTRAAGYKFRPSDAVARNPALADSTPGTTRESFVDSAGIGKQNQIDNQATTTKLAGQGIGIPGAVKLSEADFAGAKRPHGAVYDQTGAAVGTLKPTPTTTTALENLAADTNTSPTMKAEISRIQAGLADGMAGPEVMANISRLRDTNGGRPLAGVLEDAVGSQLKANGNPTQLAAYQKAREGFAKIYNVQDATTGGQVDAHDLKRLYENNPGLLTGEHKIIAQAAAEVPDALRMPSGGTPSSGNLSKSGIIERGVRAAVGKIPGMDLRSDAFLNQFGPVASDAERSYFGDYGRKPQPLTPAFTPPAGPTLALPAPDMTATPSGTVGTADALSRAGMTADVLRAGALHPGVARPASAATLAANVPPPPLRLPAPGGVAMPMTNDAAAAAAALRNSGLTPDILAAAAQHPGAPGNLQPPPRLALPAPPAPGRPIVVDTAGRAASSSGVIADYKKQMGIGETPEQRKQRLLLQILRNQ